MELRIAIGLAIVLSGCLPDREAPGTRGFFGSPRRPPPPPAAPPPTAAPPPWQGPTPSPGLPEPRGPGPAAPPHLLDDGPLPAPWPAEVFDVVAQRLARRVVASEDVVGLAALTDGLLVVERRGGLLRSNALNRFIPEVTPLPEPVTRVFADGDRLVACTPPLQYARFSLDGGRTWASLGFQCGAGGRRTIAGAGELTYALVDGQLRVGILPRGRPRYTALPVESPWALGAYESAVVVFGATEVARSSDAGRTFAVAPRPALLSDVRDVLFVGKATVLAAGRAANVPSGSALVRSTDGGLSWRPVPLPRRLDAVAALAQRGDGAILAVPENASDGAVLSVDGGRTFEPLPPSVLAEGAAAPLGSGFVAGSAQGLVTVVGGQAPVLGLDQPLHAVVFTHPLVAVGIGTAGGLYRTRDGGRTWRAHPGWGGIRFADLASPGGHTVMVVGEGILWRSLDAGGTFEARALPSSCRARWVRFGAEGVGLVGCRDGSLLASDDEGSRWAVAPAPPAAVQPVVFLADGTRLALTETGRLATWQAGRWTLSDAPVPAPISATGWHGGASVLSATGQMAERRPGETVWRGAPADLTGIADAVAHRPLADGRALILDAHGLVITAPDGAPQRLLEASSAHAFALTGDGGVLVLHDTATSLFSAR